MPVSEVRLEHRIAAVAARQHGSISIAQLRACGVSNGAVGTLVGRGALHRIHRGVYAVGHPSLSQQGAWMAGVLSGGDGAVLSHVAAAQLWEITRRRSRRVEISTPRYRRATAGVTQHLLRPLQDVGDVTIRDGIPVTTLERTIVDLACVVDVEELSFTLHEAAYRHEVKLEVIDAVIAANPRFTGRGTLRTALERHRAGHTGSRSRLERRVGRYLESVGVPPGIAGLHVPTPMGPIEVDRGWRSQRVYLEVDGFGHRRPSTKRTDRERAQALDLAGWTRCVVIGDEFDADPAAATEGIRSRLR